MSNNRPNTFLAKRRVTSSSGLMFIKLLIGKILKRDTSSEKSNSNSLKEWMISTKHSTLMVERSSHGQSDQSLESSFREISGEKSLIPEAGVRFEFIVSWVVFASLLSSGEDTIEETTTPESCSEEDETFRAGENTKSLRNGDTSCDDSSEDSGVPGVDYGSDSPEEILGLNGVVDSAETVGDDGETTVKGERWIDTVLEDADIDEGFLPRVML